MFSTNIPRSKNSVFVVRRLSAAVAVMLGMVFTAGAYAGSNGTGISVDTSNWQCRLCTYAYGWTGNLDAGLTNVSSSSYKYGEYTGLIKSGLYPLADGNASNLNKDGQYFDVTAINLGLSSRDISIEGGKQGFYELNAEFHEIPQYIANTGRTPFLGIGSDTLTLPGNWAAGGSTGQMTNLNRDLQNVDIENTRRIAAVGIKIMPPRSSWRFSVKFQRDTRDGVNALGANFLTTSSILSEAFDYSTNQLRASADYAVDKWQVGFGYYASFFQDANAALTWSNPFIPLTPGATQGQMSQPPNNNFNAVSFSGAWQALANTRLIATASIGRGTQNAVFLAPTVNSQLSTAPLPRSSLDGVIDTMNYALRAYSYVLPDLSLTADYSVNRRDNHTPQATYQQVITDTYLSNYAVNIPYSFSNQLGRLIADYHLTSNVHVEGGGSYENQERVYSVTASTQTDTLWASIRANPFSSLSANLKVTHARRFSPEYTPIDDLFAPQNPLMRQFDLANRTRNQISGQLAYAPIAQWSAGISAESNDDQYDGTTIGLTRGKDFNYTLNLTYTPVNAFNINGYYTQERTSWRQANSQTYSTADWYGDNENAFQTVGVSAEMRDIKPGLDGGVDFNYSLASGATAVSTGATGPVFPNIIMRMQSLSLYAKYRIDEKWGLKFAYRIERYATTDWSLDGVTPGAIPNVLALGIYSPNYVVNLISLSTQYTF
ncbi:MAG TPA: MtrB/PioB family decaheme-associated outer membrane protein [Gammaproteobacteria bacterium]|nr:MtrB/PioB family decaheme-associated outer membrane protein [Gammaproteobacteria bacterium]